MDGIEATMIMVTPAEGASVQSQEPSRDGLKARVEIGYTLTLWLYPEVAERLKKAIDEAVAMLPSVVEI